MNVVVVGGGPAGMIAGITSAEEGNNVILVEKNSSLGNKLKITGKGRCNITNDCDIEELIENVPLIFFLLYRMVITYCNIYSI